MNTNNNNISNGAIVVASTSGLFFDQEAIKNAKLNYYITHTPEDCDINPYTSDPDWGYTSDYIFDIMDTNDHPHQLRVFAVRRPDCDYKRIDVKIDLEDFDTPPNDPKFKQVILDLLGDQVVLTDFI